MRIRKKSPWARRSGRLQLHIAPILVWVAALACVVGLFSHRSRRFEVLGVARGQLYQVAANCPGRVKSVAVTLFDQVQQGQLLAVVDMELDNQHLQTELAVVKAEIDHLSSQLEPIRQQMEAEAANLQTDKLASQRQFIADVEDTRIQILGFKLQLATDRATLADTEGELKIAEQLLREDGIAPYEVQKLQALCSTLRQSIEENQSLLAQAEEDLKEKEKRQDAFAQRQLQHPPVDSALEVIRRDIVVQEKLLAQLLEREKPLELKSPFDAVVSQVLRSSGETIEPNVPILVLSEHQPADILAYAAEDQIGEIELGMTVEIIKFSKPMQRALSQVVSVGPAVEQMPMQLWLRPNLPQWGMPFLIRIHPDMKLAAGEKVGIRKLYAKR